MDEARVEVTAEEIQMAIEVSAMALIGMLAEIGQTKVATVIAAAMQSIYAKDEEQGKRWLEELSVVAEKVKSEYALTKIVTSDAIN